MLAEWERTQRALDAPGWIEAFLRFVPGPHRTDDQVDRRVLDEVRLMVTDTLAHHLPADPATADGPPMVPGEEPWSRLADLAVPLLGVVGELDAADHHAMVTRAVDTAPHAQRAVVPASAHYPNMERPDEFNDIVGRFLDGH